MCRNIACRSRSKHKKPAIRAEGNVIRKGQVFGVLVGPDK